MKKTIAMLLALCMLFALSACSLDSLVASAENKVVKTFKVNASGDPEANLSAFAANSCLVLLDASSAAEQMRAYISCALGYLEAEGILEAESENNSADISALVNAAYDANEGRSVESMKNILSSASIGLENLRLTLPEGDSTCTEILSSVDELVSLLTSADSLISGLSAASLEQAAGMIDRFETSYSNLYSSISAYRMQPDR